MNLPFTHWLYWIRPRLWLFVFKVASSSACRQAARSPKLSHRQLSTEMRTHGNNSRLTCTFDGGQLHCTWHTLQYLFSMRSVAAKNVEDVEDALKLPKFWTDFDLETCSFARRVSRLIKSVKEILQQWSRFLSEDPKKTVGSCRFSLDIRWKRTQYSRMRHEGWHCWRISVLHIGCHFASWSVRQWRAHVSNQNMQR